MSRLFGVRGRVKIIRRERKIQFNFEMNEFAVYRWVTTVDG